MAFPRLSRHVRADRPVLCQRALHEDLRLIVCPIPSLRGAVCEVLIAYRIVVSPAGTVPSTEHHATRDGFPGALLNQRVLQRIARVEQYGLTTVFPTKASIT